MYLQESGTRSARSCHRTIADISTIQAITLLALHTFANIWDIIRGDGQKSIRFSEENIAEARSNLHEWFCVNSSEMSFGGSMREPMILRRGESNSVSLPSTYSSLSQGAYSVLHARILIKI